MMRDRRGTEWTLAIARQPPTTEDVLALRPVPERSPTSTDDRGNPGDQGRVRRPSTGRGPRCRRRHCSRRGRRSRRRAPARREATPGSPVASNGHRTGRAEGAGAGVVQLGGCDGSARRQCCAHDENATIGQAPNTGAPFLAPKADMFANPLHSECEGANPARPRTGFGCGGPMWGDMGPMWRDNGDLWPSDGVLTARLGTPPDERGLLWICAGRSQRRGSRERLPMPRHSSTRSQDPCPARPHRSQTRQPKTEEHPP